MTISPYQIDGILKFYSKMTEVSERRSSPDPHKERDYDRVTLSSSDNKTVVFNRISETLLDMIVKGAPQESDPVE